jgi:hypothetical protein
MADEWYYACDGQQLGPITTAGLRLLLAKGKVRPGDLVWRDGMSNWAPAAESRELCPAPAAAVKSRAAAAAPAAPVDDLPLAREDSPPSRPKRRYEDDDDDYDRPRPRRRRAQAGMSTGAKIAIFGGIAAFFLFGLVLVAVIIIVAVNTAKDVAKTPPAAAGGGNPGGGGGGGNPAAGVGQANTYSVDFFAQNQQNVKVVNWAAGQNVNITVTTTEWGGGPEPTVFMWVEDMAGRRIAEDQSNIPKDCWTTLRVPATGQYRIIVVLAEGRRAHCIVRY